MRKVGILPLAAQLATFLVVLAMTLSSSATSAQARQWKPARQALIEDYLEIIDQREGQFTLVFWLASPMIPNRPDAAALLDKYVVIMALHAKVDPDAVASYTKIESLDVQDGNHQALKPIPEDKWPPTLTGALSTIGAALKQMLGVLGQHLQYFVYESGGINACRHGRLFVNYNGESYSYDMPIPGC